MLRAETLKGVESYMVLDEAGRPQGRRATMGGNGQGKTEDIVFEGVLIPRRTRSAKIAAKGIRDEEDMGAFLTAVFCDTLNGKIVLPRPGVRGGKSAKTLNRPGQRLKKGLPVTIQPIDPNRKLKRRSRVPRLTMQGGD
jgi:hypothetical protein